MSESFYSLLTEMGRIDDAMGDPNLDMPGLIGDVRDKVDALNAVLNRIEATAQYLEEMAKPLIAKARALKNNHARLTTYIVESLEKNNVSAVPGNAYKLALVRASIPSLKIEPATPESFTAWPDFVQIQRSYTWDNAKVKDFLANNKAVPVDFPGKLEYSYRPKFSANVPESLEKKKGKK